MKNETICDLRNSFSKLKFAERYDGTEVLVTPNGFLGFPIGTPKETILDMLTNLEAENEIKNGNRLTGHERLRKAILYTVPEFEAILNDIYGQIGVRACIEADGLSFYADEDENWLRDELDICDALSSYLGLQVISFHIDDAPETGVWVVYRDIGDMEARP